MVYSGRMKDGKFHGEGLLTFPMGQRVEGTWDDGKLIKYKYHFADGLEYEHDWKYCKMPDRRSCLKKYWTLNV